MNCERKMEKEKAKAKRGESQKSGERKKKLKMSSVKRKIKDKKKTVSRIRKKKAAREKKSSSSEERKVSSSTSSGANTPSSGASPAGSRPASRAVTPVKESEKEKEKEKEKEREKEPPESTKRNSRVEATGREWKEEKEPDSELDADLVVKKSHAVLGWQKGQPKKIDIRHTEVKDDDIKSLLVKLKEDKMKLKAPVLMPMDEKAKLLMDRVTKNRSSMAGVLKYTRRKMGEKLVDEDDDYFRPRQIEKRQSHTAVVPEDAYDHVQKLSEIQKLPEENVYAPIGVPFWAVYLEPSLDEMKDVDEPISVGSDHIQEYHDKKLTLKTSRPTKLLLDEYHPMATLQKRDDDHFHPHLVFSNTIRSLVNVQAAGIRESESDVRSVPEDRTQTEESVYFSKDLNVRYTYDRSNPILSAREQVQEHNDPIMPPTSQTESISSNSSLSTSNSEEKQK